MQVGRDDDDMLFVNKVADDVGLALSFSYVNRFGGRTVRTVVVDGVYGERLEWPQYFRGLDSISGQRRTFDISSIEAVELPNGGVATTSVRFFVAMLIKRHLGLEYTKAPLKLTAPISLVVEVDDAGVMTLVEGTLQEFVVDIRSYGPRCFLTIKPGIPFKGTRRAIKMDLMPEVTGYNMKGASRVWDVDQGVEIEDLYIWAADHLGLSRDGWPLPEASGDKSQRG